MYALIRPLLFKLNPELAHRLSLKLLQWAPSCFFENMGKTQPVHAFGYEFPHRVGLAAGFDKNAGHLDALSKLNFAFIEAGTVTPRPQTGNPKPRLFRLPEARALINRMGFNNAGVDVLVANVKKSRYQGILGINIGKNKDTGLNQAADDYVHCFEKVYPYASYITVNISSPNTPDLRQLQQEGYLKNLLHTLEKKQSQMADRYGRKVPMLIKISPDENDEALKRITADIMASSAEGIIATNTTSERTQVKHLVHGGESGGLSGAPLKMRSTQCLRIIRAAAGERLTLIAAGGIDECAAAREKLNAGAHLLQVYTGLIYQGPGLIKQLSALSKADDARS